MNSKYTIIEARRLAQEQGFDRMKFVLHGAITPIECQWIDAYIGVFKAISPPIKTPLHAKDFITKEIYVTIQE